MSDTLNYACPCCGGRAEFDSSLQKMKCYYCDNVFEVEDLKSYDAVLQNEIPDQIDWTIKAGQDWGDGEADNLSVYLCNSCGGQVICDNTTAATHCPYCGNPVVIAGRFSGDLKPDYVIPFKLDKEAAKQAFFNHLKGKKLLPKLFKDQNHIDEIKGVYVPFWLFDADAEAHIRWKGTRINTWSDSKYRYTRTSFYSVVRDGNIGFERIPVDGSSKMDDDLMESIEPYDFSQAVDFQTAYLSGYLADKYDVTAEQSIGRANDRVKKSAVSAFQKTATGYTTLVPENTNVQISNGKAKYALYPVWVMNTTWNGQQFLFAMNGQTGKFVGNLPMDKGAYWKWFFIYTGIWSVVGAGGYFLLKLLEIL